MRNRRRPLIGIAMGDFNGVGPEVALRCLAARGAGNACDLVLVGSLPVYERYASRMGIRILFREVDEPRPERDKRAVPVVPVERFRIPDVRPGRVSSDAGRLAGLSLETAARLCLEGKIDAVVTAPVSKEAMAEGGYPTPGQTEMLARLCRVRNVVMLLVAGPLRVAPMTVHVPLKSVHRTLTIPLLSGKLSILAGTLRNDFGIARPRIALLGLNPHAGEGGMFGDEEDRVILPAMKRARTRGALFEGPFPADGFFGSGAHVRYDAVAAMYHDQGLVPLKLLGFGRGVNFSAGLPIVRTSPDHGTAFDIAGKGVAGHGSMMEAIRLAAAVARRRRR